VIACVLSPSARVVILYLLIHILNREREREREYLRAVELVPLIKKGRTHHHLIGYCLDLSRISLFCSLLID
jgi:hypothetical protein